MHPRDPDAPDPELIAAFKVVERVNAARVDEAWRRIQEELRPRAATRWRAIGVLLAAGLAGLALLLPRDDARARPAIAITPTTRATPLEIRDWQSPNALRSPLRHDDASLREARGAPRAPRRAAPPLAARLTEQRSRAAGSHARAGAVTLESQRVQASALAEETRLYRGIRDALGRGRPDEALARIEAHERRFPNGAFAKERAIARVRAWCALGRRQDAERFTANVLAGRDDPTLRATFASACKEDGR